MLTYDQALTAQAFHEEGCHETVGSRGGRRQVVRVWRRNGATQTWKTRPKEFRVPIKYGLYEYGQITHRDRADFHVPEACPLATGGSLPQGVTITSFPLTPPRPAEGLRGSYRQEGDRFRFERGDAVTVLIAALGAVVMMGLFALFYGAGAISQAFGCLVLGAGFLLTALWAW